MPLPEQLFSRELCCCHQAVTQMCTASFNLSPCSDPAGSRQGAGVTPWHMPWSRDNSGYNGNFIFVTLQASCKSSGQLNP